MTTRRPRLAALALAFALGAAACAGEPEQPDVHTFTKEEASERFTPAEPGNAHIEEQPSPQRKPDPSSSPAPEWLGTRPLPLGTDGYGEVRPTPPELVDRRLWTKDLLDPPPDDDFAWTLGPVPPEIQQRSTWTPECPVALEDLRYVTVTFHGFDGLPHTGELLIHRTVAEDVVGVFRTLYEARFPIEYLLITAPVHNTQPPTGDGNVSNAYNCRPARGATHWSEHAKGLAVDINPFHNPFHRRDTVLPELASAYLDRANVRPGMIVRGDVVTQAFAKIGWHWGGDWRSTKDWMHFSASGS